MDSTLDFIQIIPDHHIVPVALRILPAIAQDIRTVSVVRASLLSLIALCPAKLAVCSDILREMQGDSTMLAEDLPFWAAVAQEPGAPLGAIGIFSSTSAERIAETCLPAKNSDQEKGERQKGAEVQTKKKKKGASALMKGLRNGEVSKLVDEMEAKAEAPDVKEGGMLVGEMISQLGSCELLSKQKPHADGQQGKKKAAAALPEGLRTGEAPKLVSLEEEKLQAAVSHANDPCVSSDTQLPEFGNEKQPKSVCFKAEDASGPKGKKKRGTAALLKGLKTGEVSKIVDAMEAETQACVDKRYSFGDQLVIKTEVALPNQSCPDVPALATFDDFWKHFEDMPMLDRFTLSLQEEELKKMRDAGACLRSSPHSSWIKREVELESNRKDLRSLMNQGVSFQLDMDPASRQL